MNRFLPFAAVCFGGAAMTPAFSQFCDVDVEAMTPAVQSQFGSTVALSPDSTIAAVGSPFGGPLGCSGGSVTLFELDGANWTAVAELTSPSGECDGQFGYDVDITFDKVVVGAPFENAGGVADSGRAYVYRKVGGTWTLTDTLEEVTHFQNSRFGHSVSAHGTRIAVGAIRSGFFGPSAGAVYMFRDLSGQFLFEDRLAPNPPQPGAFFGTSVSLFATHCAVGAVYENSVASQSGAAYMFEQQPNTTWDEVAKFVPTSTFNNTYFGIAVATWGPHLVIGAEGADNGATNSGSAFTYIRDNAGNWNETGELSSSAPVANGTFGRAVSITSDLLAVSDQASGRVETYAFAPGMGWDHAPTNGVFSSSTGAFGTEIDLQTGALIVGAPLRSGSIPFSGGASIYALEFDDCNANGFNDVCEVATFGVLVDCDGNGMIDTCEIAADPSLDCDGNSELDSCQLANDPSLDCDGNGAIDACEIAADASLDCNANLVLDVCDINAGMATDVNGNLVIDDCEALGSAMNCQTLPNSTGVPGQLAAIGSAAVTANDVALIGTEMPLNMFGFPIVSRSTGSNVPMNSVGFLCLGGTIGRDYSQVFFTGSSGTVEVILDVDLQQIPQGAGSSAAVAGETWYWQLWHRDMFAGQNTSTFTDSIQITFE